MLYAVAKSYFDWEPQGEPIRENGVYYVTVKHPKYNINKKVRAYTDMKHLEAMPGFNAATAPLWTLFGFKTKDDKIKYIKEVDLSEDEVNRYFIYNWEHSTSNIHWRFGAFMSDKNNRGIWYSPLDAEDFPIENKDCVKTITWAEFKKCGQAQCRAMGIEHSKYWDEV